MISGLEEKISGLWKISLASGKPVTTHMPP
jgi:hypothetical protein